MEFQAFGGRLRGRLPNGVPVFSTPPGAITPFNRLDSRGRTKVRISMPAKGLNRGRVFVSSAMNPRAGNGLEFSVPAVIVIDPGHGGHTNLAGSSFNNSRTPNGVLGKTLTLDYDKELAKALTQRYEGQGLPSRVALTRDRDINLTVRNRAELARNLGADAFVTIHFNGFDGTKRGTLEVQRTPAKGNINVAEDTALANHLVTAVVNAFKVYDRGANKRAPVPYATSVSSNPYQGNTAAHHPVRHAYLELDFIDNPIVGNLLTGSQRHQVRATVAGAMAQAIFNDIASHRG
ncbi:N-acetylmuramoyl-L-alanine amidase [Verrucomicrobiales bacterium]|nr:N-acetylmuramoyl-L-alanine amidase [Verrucomicrobiales bacterium]MDF1785574.1 N-acetylmuramoyl-L-alanine amidase [Verrucomicrobiales bacterium]